MSGATRTRTALDGLYSAGGVDHLIEWVHDSIDARGHRARRRDQVAVVVSVESIGLFENQTKRMQAAVRAALPTGNRRHARVQRRPQRVPSPDAIGLYGAPEQRPGRRRPLRHRRLLHELPRRSRR